MSAIHEDYRQQLHGRGPSDRNFGSVFTVAFLFFGLWPLRHHLPVRLWRLAVSAAFLLVTLIRPSLLHPLNRIWTQCGILLGKVVNPIVASLLFYLVFTPIAIVLRWMGKDLLRLAGNPNAQTYWIHRDDAANPADMRNQF